MKFIFLDTFALAQLTKDHYQGLSAYLGYHRLHLVVSSLQLIEYYSPILEGGDRTNRAIRLLATHPFVIVNQNDVFEQEEAIYPGSLRHLPYRLNSEEVIGHLSFEERCIILFQLTHEGIPQAGFDLPAWTAVHNSSKLDWPNEAAAIIENAEAKYLTKSKAKFLHSHDLRFCHTIVDAIEKLGDRSKQDRDFKQAINKLTGMQNRMDTWRKKGIHLSSLIFWYDYLVAKKKIKPSDQGDLFHAMLFPYCDLVVTDNSRVDCLETIQRKEQKYLDVKFSRISDFISGLTIFDHE